MDKFTILLLYPEHVSDAVETYMTCHQAETVADACKAAQEECANENEGTTPEDWRVICTIAGDHSDLTPPEFR